jgi:hypothetical protein
MALELPKFGKKDKEAGSAKQKSDVALKIMDFFEKNPWMKIVIPALLFIILVAVFIFAMFGDGILSGDNTGVDSNVPVQNEVLIGPGNNIIKDPEIVELIEDDPLSEDILASAKYTGSVVSETGLKTALIQIGTVGDKLVLCAGETVGDSSWELVEIYDEYVIFKAGEITKKIKLS